MDKEEFTLYGITFGFDRTGAFNSTAYLPSGRLRGVYLINGKRVSEAEWFQARADAYDAVHYTGADRDRAISRLEGASYIQKPPSPFLQKLAAARALVAAEKAAKDA